ncbi:hypothetical protein BDZ89DRAFT_1115537 [Hymenopellis radicata]|nr:hypothetical protein BDZ89DRAFT_1115537 [Hymenopellis radicata]
MTSTASQPNTTSTSSRVDRSIPRTMLVAGYCFNAQVLLKWARHVLKTPYGEELNDVANAMFDMSEVTKNKYDIILHPLGEELTAEALENMIITQYFDFPKGYLGYPQDQLPKVEEGPWEARVREVLIKEGLSPNDFYFARRLTEM